MQSTQAGRRQPTHRRHAPTDAPRPDIAWDLARTIAACTAAAAVRPAPAGLTVADYVHHVAETLPYCDTDNTNAVAGACSDLAQSRARRHRDTHLARAERTARDVAGTAVAIDPTNPAAFCRSLRPLGVSADDATTWDVAVDALLDATLDATVLRALSRLISGQQRYDQISDGRVRTAARTAMTSATVPACGIDDVVAGGVQAGLDAEALVWSIITRESRRHIGLVWQRSNKLAGVMAGHSAEALAGFGWQGLRMALRKYDPSTAAFSTYAAHRIDGTIRDGVRAENPIPKRLGTFARKVTATEEDLLCELGRAPTLSELATKLGVPEVDLHIMPRLTVTASLDELADSDRAGDHPAWADTTSAAPDDEMVGDALRAAVADAVAQLPEPEATAVRLLDLEGLTMTEAEARTGATARQLRSRRSRGRELLADTLADWAELVDA